MKQFTSANTSFKFVSLAAFLLEDLSVASVTANEVFALESAHAFVQSFRAFINIYVEEIALFRLSLYLSI